MGRYDIPRVCSGRNPMRNIYILPIILSFVAPMFMGCKEKVDCDKLETRLITCMEENYKAANPAGCPLNAPECEKIRTDLMAKYAALVDKEFVAPCKAKSGRDSRAKKINACLDQKGCGDVQACLKEVAN